MKEGYEYFQSICDHIGKRVQGVLMDPFYWVMMFLLLCCMVMAYSGASQGRLAGSIVNTLRQAGSFLIDTFNSIIQACRSLFGFLDVLKLLFFGHLGHSTLYVLTNYAIIFLSMASFFTTLQGLYSLIGLTGFLVSFGVQVMELVTAMGLIICWVPPKGKLKETVTYKHCDSKKINPCMCSQSSNEPSQLIRNNQESSWWQLTKQLWQGRFRWGNFKRLMLPILLLLSYSASATFSYSNGGPA